MHVSNVGIAIRRGLFVKTWSKSGQVTSLWLGLWSATIVLEAGETERCLDPCFGNLFLYINEYFNNQSIKYSIEGIL
jgi:hypothetical protein